MIHDHFFLVRINPTAAANISNTNMTIIGMLYSELTYTKVGASAPPMTASFASMLIFTTALCISGKNEYKSTAATAIPDTANAKCHARLADSFLLTS